MRVSPAKMCQIAYHATVIEVGVFEAGADVSAVWAQLLLSPWARVFAFVWGLLWGSFANVVIYRLPRDMSVVRPRSRCSECETPIAAYDNIPVISYLVLRGRCRHCKAPFGLRYMMVELLVGVLSFALFMLYVHVPLVAGKDPTLLPWALWFVFGFALLVITYIDLDVWIIPDKITLPLTVLGWSLAIFVPTLLGVSWQESFGASLGGYLVFAGIRWLYLKLRGIEALGLGDAKLLLMVGAFTGLPGLVWCIGIGALQGLLVAVPMLLLGRKVANTDLREVHGDDPLLGTQADENTVMSTRVPFGPFLALASLEYVLLRPMLDPWLDGLL